MSADRAAGATPAEPWYRKRIVWILILGTAALLVTFWWKNRVFGLLGPWPVASAPVVREVRGAGTGLRERLVVAVEVTNRGRAGMVLFTATFVQGERKFKRRLSAYLEAGQRRTLELVFQEPELKKGNPGLRWQLVPD